MALELFTIPCLSDNCAFVIHNPATGATALVDAPEAAPIIAFLDAKGFTLDEILITHHHNDHVAGLAELRARYGARVTGGAADAHRLPALDRAVAGGDTFDFGGESVRVIDVYGHTIGHIAFYLPLSGILFSADSLMALGCGRLSEGTPAQMWDTMQRLRELPDETIVCSGHEYTATNARFALTIDPDNPELKARATAVLQDRANGLPTVPSRLGEEKRTNPYLRADNADLKRVLGMEHATALQVFTEVRTRKDNF